MREITGASHTYSPPGQWTNSVLLKVPQGRHNVAHRGSGGKMSRDGCGLYLQPARMMTRKPRQG
jgi:hypothetical protein